MNLKRIICLLLALILLLSLVTGAVSLLVMNASAAELTTQPTTAQDTTQPTESSEPTVNQMELKNGDKIVVFVLGAIVPCIIFLVMLVKVVWRGK